MKAFVWKRLEKVTDNWHPEGGVLVIAQTLDKAQEMLAAANIRDVSESALPAPYLEMDIDTRAQNVDPQIVVFPDAGCC